MTDALQYLPALTIVATAMVGTASAVCAVVYGGRFFRFFLQDVRKQRYPLAATSLFIALVMWGLATGLIAAAVHFLPVE